MTPRPFKLSLISVFLQGLLIQRHLSGESDGLTACGDSRHLVDIGTRSEFLCYERYREGTDTVLLARQGRNDLTRHIEYRDRDHCRLCKRERDLGRWIEWVR